MSKIVIGKARSGRSVSIDLDILLRTRAIVTANSGGGKSWLLRRMAEQIWGKVPVWIIDPEGEFASLREKFGFVLVGKGGETPADTRSADLVCHKLLELGASAVFDLYELKPANRQMYVRALLESLINAPKNLWRPLVVALDELHVYCPEKGQGESEASGAVQDLATRGRKRGFCLVGYSQRAAKVSKTVTAELINRITGMTVEGIDLDRACDVMSVPKGDRDDFRLKLKELEQGEFYCLGPAISRDRVHVKIAGVQTAHPELGKAKYSAEPPPAPEKIRAMLPKLQDLPKEAEKKAQTEKELRAEIQSYRAQLATRPKEEVTKTEIERVEVPIIKDGQIDRLEKVSARLHEDKAKLDSLTAEIVTAVAEARKIEDRTESRIKGFNAGRMAGKPILALRPVPAMKPKTAEALQRTAAFAVKQPSESAGNGELTPAREKILAALSQFEAIGRQQISRNWVAARAGASHKSSSYSNNLGALRTAGLISYGAEGSVKLTEEGRKVAPTFSQPLSTGEMLESCLKILVPAQARILKAVHAMHPQAMDRETLAAAAGASATSSSFSNNLGALRSAGMIEYVEGGVKASNWLFID